MKFSVSRLEELETKVSKYLEVGKQIPGDKRMELSKVASNIINQINMTDMRINREKTGMLLQLIGGKIVNKTSTGGDEHLTNYVKDHITSMIVKLGHDKQAIGVNMYARVIVELMACHRDMWDLFCYHVFNRCPFLVPFNPPVEGLEEEERMKAKGQRLTEKIDLYIARMGNCAELYGMVLAMLSKKQGFHVPVQTVGWGFLARTLSLRPENGVTAVILHKFLSSAGFFLQQAYCGQFVKLMNYLKTNYILKIGEVTTNGGQQAYTLLQNFLKDFETTRQLKQNVLIDKPW